MKGDRLKLLRVEKEMSQQKLADLLGCTVSLVSMYESNTKNPSQEKIIRMAEIFDVTIDYLLGSSFYKHAQKNEDASQEDIDNIKLFEYAKESGLSNEELKEAIDFIVKMKKKEKKD